MISSRSFSSDTHREKIVRNTHREKMDRINQHIPKSIRNANSILKRSLPSRACKSSTPNPTQTCDSAIGLHLLNASCAKHYHQDRFRILARGRSAFHLSVLESIFIKTSNPDLCRQKEFVYSLKIYRWLTRRNSWSDWPISASPPPFFLFLSFSLSFSLLIHKTCRFLTIFSRWVSDEKLWDEITILCYTKEFNFFLVVALHSGHVKRPKKDIAF